MRARAIACLNPLASWTFISQVDITLRAVMFPLKASALCSRAAARCAAAICCSKDTLRAQQDSGRACAAAERPPRRGTTQHESEACRCRLSMQSHRGLIKTEGNAAGRSMCMPSQIICSRL